MKLRRRYLALFIVIILASVAGPYIKQQYVAPIIMYHRIDNKSQVSMLSVSPKSFERQMAFLKRHNYNVVPLDKLADMLKQDKIPYKTIAITFDDGYENNYTSAFPVLKKYGLPAVIFIIPALIGTEDYMTWDQVVEIAESGVVSIGSHTMNHKFLTSIPEQSQDIEVFDSKRAIESHIKKQVTCFSYPLGNFDEHIKQKVIRAGYKIAVATNPGKNYPKHDLFAMKRLRISNTSDNLFVFWIKISGFYTWIKEHRDSD